MKCTAVLLACLVLLIAEGRAAARRTRDRPSRGPRGRSDRKGRPSDNDRMEKMGAKMLEEILGGMKAKFTGGSLAYTCVDEADGNESDAKKCWSCFMDAMKGDDPNAYIECGNEYIQQSVDGCSEEISAFQAAGDDDSDATGMTALKCFNRLSNRRALESCMPDVDTELPLNEQFKQLSKCRWGIVLPTYEVSKEIMKGGESRRDRMRRPKQEKEESEIKNMMKRQWADLMTKGHCDSKQESETARNECYTCFKEVEMNTEAGVEEVKECTDKYLNVDEKYDYSECTNQMDEFSNPPTEEQKGMVLLCYMGKMEEYMIDECADKAGEEGSLIDQFMNVEKGIVQMKLESLMSSDINCLAKTILEESIKMHEA